MRTFKATIATIGTPVPLYTPSPTLEYAETLVVQAQGAGNVFVGVKGIVGSTLTNVGFKLAVAATPTVIPFGRQVDVSNIWLDTDTNGNTFTALAI